MKLVITQYLVSKLIVSNHIMLVVYVVAVKLFLEPVVCCMREDIYFICTVFYLNCVFCSCLVE